MATLLTSNDSQFFVGKSHCFLVGSLLFGKMFTFEQLESKFYIKDYGLSHALPAGVFDSFTFMCRIPISSPRNTQVYHNVDCLLGCSTCHIGIPSLDCSTWDIRKYDIEWTEIKHWASNDGEFFYERKYYVAVTQIGCNLLSLDWKRKADTIYEIILKVLMYSWIVDYGLWCLICVREAVIIRFSRDLWTLLFWLVMLKKTKWVRGVMQSTRTV